MSVPSSYFLRKKNFEKFKGESDIFDVLKGTCFAWGVFNEEK